MTVVWLGDISVREAVRSGTINLHGSRPFADSFERWLPLSRHAQHERPPEPLNLQRLLATSQSEVSE